jgi:excisionase family DNA binding protein
MYKDKKLLRISEVAALLDVRVQRAWEMGRHGILPIVRLGRQMRVDPDQLEAWLAAGGHPVGVDRGHGIG